jgi:hypothetical protein
MAKPKHEPRSKELEPVPARTATQLFASHSLVASTARYAGNVATVYSTVKEWQREAYRHYGICGEARFAANYFGHSMSRATLYAAQDLKKGSEPLTTGTAAAALDDLFNGADGQAQMLTAMGKHLTIAGECYLVGRTVDVTDSDNEVIGEDDIWEVLSCLEVKNNGGNWSIKSVDEGKPDILLSDDDAVIRIWRPHPEYRLEADSPFRSLLPILQEIEWLTLHIFAQCSSRLAGAGLLFVTQGIDFPPPKDDQGRPVEYATAAEGLMAAMTDYMMSAIRDPANPASLVPGTVSVPEEVMKSGKIAELVHFWTDLDAASLEMRNAAVHRFAIGMDMSPEKIEGNNSSTGGGNTNGPNHWGMWQTTEETITLHIEPMLDLITNSLTIGYLRPLTGGTEVVRYETSKLRLRPDRSKEAMELFNLGLLKPEVVVKENGFDPENDMLDDDDRQTFLLMKIAGGSATPDQVGAALKALGVDLGLPVAVQGQSPREARPAPTLEDHPARDIPEAASLLLHVCEPLILRGLERAGNRLRQTLKGGVEIAPGTKSYEVHTVIQANGTLGAVTTDAFATADICLNGIVDPARVLPLLEGHLVDLIANQKPYSREGLAKVLESVA